MDYDWLLEDYVGQFGLWQKLVSSWTPKKLNPGTHRRQLTKSQTDTTWSLLHVGIGTLMVATYAVKTSIAHL